MKLLITLILAFVIFAGPSAADLTSGDAAFRRRAVDEQAREALRVYEESTENSQSADALWRVAMANYFVGLRLTQAMQEKAKIFARGRNAGLAALALKPDCAECHFWTAVNMALYGDTVGVFKMLFSLQEIQQHLRATLKLNPSYANGGAYRILGLIEQKLPGILGGSNSRAKEDFEKAIELAPDEPLNYQFLATLLHETEKDPTPSLAAAKRGLEITDLSPDRLESIEAQQELRKMLSSWSR